MLVAKIVLSFMLTSLSLLSTANALFSPLETPKNINSQQAELGKKLFFDPRLSKSGFISCNSCHNLSLGGTDNLPTSIGHNWQQGPINSPTVLNSSYNLAQFWDGRAKDLQEQAAGPIANPKEMGSNHDLDVSVLKSIPAYVSEFKAAYGNNTLTINEVTHAIAEFEKTLITPNSAFDLYLKGDKTAMSEEALAGFELFKSSGCSACHNGPALGGQAYFKMGMVKPYKTKNPAKGRIDVTGKASDLMVFKVPTLRNVELSYPYFHDGQVQHLRDAVAIMGKLQLAKDFNGTQLDQLVAFLKALTGEQPQLVLPILPPSNYTTPIPEAF